MPTTRSRPVQTQQQTPIATLTSTSASTPRTSKIITSEATVPKKSSRESVVTASKKSEANTVRTPKRSDAQLPIFRRSNQSITAAGKVTTKPAPRRESPANAAASTTPTQTSTQTAEKSTATNTPKAAPPVAAKVENRTSRVSDLLRQPNAYLRNARQRRVDGRLSNSGRADGSRLPKRNEEIARSVMRSNQQKSQSYRHQPSPTTIKNVRKNFHGYNHYWTNDWYRHHPTSWHPATIPDRKWWYRPYWRDTCDWFDAAFFAGFLWRGALNTYNYHPYYYGNNIIYSGDMVYVNGVPYVSSAEYYRQALELSRTADALVKAENVPQVIVVNQPANEQQNQPPQIDEAWMPMGTFAFLELGNENENINLIANENNKPNVSQMVLQIATNKMGQIRGNFVDEKNNSIRQMIGAVDPKTQRVALRFVDNDKEVWECGLWNLTQDTLPVLIHLDETKVEQKTLVRLVNDVESETDLNENEIELAP
ncbi:MAG: hypothetical protein LBJ00_05645 [Planctomycetaceae bacterium]|nr:hypothetical protein [Planctomycetaceae bacterium]